MVVEAAARSIYVAEMAVAVLKCLGFRIAFVSVPSLYRPQPDAFADPSLPLREISWFFWLLPPQPLSVSAFVYLQGVSVHDLQLRPGL